MEKGISAWQLTMMALGTVIGGSFFLGVAIGIKQAGASILISYIVGGILVYFILAALSEMTIADPAPGSFRTFAEKAFGPGVGFVVGWVYWTGIVLAMSSEATAVAILLREWLPGASVLLIGSGVIIAVTLVNLLGAERLSKLESGLAAIKLLALIGFIIFAVLLIVGFMPGAPRVGVGALATEAWFPAGIGGIAGSMLIVIFTYAGFEIIGLAASETKNPHKTVPKAIFYTVVMLIGLYILTIAVLLPLIPTASLTEEVSPMVAALSRYGLGWAGLIINIVLVTAILSTMLASMFGLGRMIRSLADEGHAPSWIKSKKDVPYRGILFSGVGMLIGLGLGTFLPQKIYVFLVSSGGFALLFTYVVIMATHYKYRRKGNWISEIKEFPGYPYSSYLVLISLLAVIGSMPLVKGQGAGLVAGIILVVMYTVIYLFVKKIRAVSTKSEIFKKQKELLTNVHANMQMEASEEWHLKKKK
ncbi:amino acid permease [Niallia sp. 01092]|uniref:amino acid permease n=1 Tax=unclassified Niallia TaxID=2837522 RepID=UPI003FD16B57